MSDFVPYEISLGTKMEIEDSAMMIESEDAHLRMHVVELLTALVHMESCIARQQGFKEGVDMCIAAIKHAMPNVKIPKDLTDMLERER